MEKQKYREINNQELKSINGGFPTSEVYTTIEIGSIILFDESPTGYVIKNIKENLKLDEDFCDAEAFPGQPIADACDCSECK